MVTMVIWTLLALGAAAVVLVVASVADTRSDDTATGATGVRGYLDDVRAGLRTLRSERPHRSADRGASRRQPRRPDRTESDLDDFLAATEVHAPAYVAVEDLTETLTRARERAARGVSGLTRR